MKECCKNCAKYEKPTRLRKGFCNHYHMDTRWYENCKHFKNKEEMEQELKDMIEDLYQQGLAPEEIAEELGLDETKVMDYCATIL